jgi:hypothetical protein
MPNWRVEFNVWGPHARWNTLPVAKLYAVTLDAPNAYVACMNAADGSGYDRSDLTLRSIEEIKPGQGRRTSDFGVLSPKCMDDPRAASFEPTNG